MASTCLPLIARPDARVLILGSLPGRVSLEQQKYYAHPKNQFWPIMAHLFHFAKDDEKRTDRLLDNRIALWDVCAAAHRPDSSLDSAIRKVVPNDFASFFASHPAIELIACNGGKAFDLFQRHVAPKLSVEYRRMVEQLPSTSPAHARLSLEAKRQAWSVIDRRR
jgi:hypoxanthine-DNA glycosylase